MDVECIIHSIELMLLIIIKTHEVLSENFQLAFHYNLLLFKLAQCIYIGLSVSLFFLQRKDLIFGGLDLSF